VATGGANGAGIGGGFSGAGGVVHIEDAATVTATGDSGGMGIGGGYLAAAGTIDIYARATPGRRGREERGGGRSVYAGETYVHVASTRPSLSILSATGGFVISAVTNGFSGYVVEGADCLLLTNGAWGRTLERIT